MMKRHERKLIDLRYQREDMLAHLKKVLKHKRALFGINPRPGVPLRGLRINRSDQQEEHAEYYITSTGSKWLDRGRTCRRTSTGGYDRCCCRASIEEHAGPAAFSGQDAREESLFSRKRETADKARRQKLAHLHR